MHSPTREGHHPSLTSAQIFSSYWFWRYSQGFQALQAHRLAHALWGAGRRTVALAMQLKVSEVFGVDVHPAARLGRGGGVTGEGGRGTEGGGMVTGERREGRGGSHPGVGGSRERDWGCTAVVCVLSTQVSIPKHLLPPKPCTLCPGPWSLHPVYPVLCTKHPET
jgi:hypothetical protein